jgi:[protein-PII] uridylyltransferase
MNEPAFLSALSAGYLRSSSAIRENFERDRDGATVLRGRTEVVDRLVGEMFAHHVSAGPNAPPGLCLAAVGGYGRRELHPHSDVDVVWICADAASESRYREPTAAAVRDLWDLGLRSTGGLRTIGECKNVIASNPAFAIALLDARYLAGDAQLFDTLHKRTIPEMIAREGDHLVANLDDLSRQRHRKFGDTIFHLEPNLKEGPGGLRDYHVARWLALIAGLEEDREWKAPETLRPEVFTPEAAESFAFLVSARALLHFTSGRDDNHLTYEMQDRAAQLGIGVPARASLPVAEWMRGYFRHARAVAALSNRLRDEATRSRRSLYAAFEDWRARLSNAEFSVIAGRIFLRQPEQLTADSGLVLRMFEMSARHGLEPSAEAERDVVQALPKIAPGLPELAETGLSLQEILVLPYAAQALRAMHRMGVLAAMVPEFQAIDALVARDFYHRYTVDEHTFNAIQVLHELPKRKRRAGKAADPREPSDRDMADRFGGLLGEVERPELLFLALLLHDLGKGLGGAEHVEGSVRGAEQVLSRMGTSPEEDRTVLFLIAHHLEMSTTLMRRDIFEPATIHEFSRKMGTAERLKMLTLMTYADVKSVNPEALTPWKADSLWQLYVSADNRLTRSLDDERLPLDVDDSLALDEAWPSTPVSEKPSNLHAFLAGFPERYLAAHAPGEILEHLAMAESLQRTPAQIRLERGASWWQLTLVTRDRPLLFATITGVLASWGMNIVKAEAFSNAQGIVLDVFGFDDVHRTLELNPSEIARFEQSLTGALSNQASLDSIGREVSARRLSNRAEKLRIATQVRFDDASSARSTLLELVTADQPGLLFDVSRTLAHNGCNIEVALIDTEGQRAIDVFYLTIDGAKLSTDQKNRVRESLMRALPTTARSSTERATSDKPFLQAEDA